MIPHHLNKTNHLNRLCIKKQAGWEGSRFQVIFLFINHKKNIIKKMNEPEGLDLDRALGLA